MFDLLFKWKLNKKDIITVDVSNLIDLHNLIFFLALHKILNIYLKTISYNIILFVKLKLYLLIVHVIPPKSTNNADDVFEELWPKKIIFFKDIQKYI